MMDRLRYFLAIFNLIVIPGGMLFWFLIHPWARWWRSVGLIRSYLIIGLVSVAFGTLLYRLRGSLLGADRGTNWSLIPVTLVLYGVMTWLEFQYWKQLSIATLVGIPELSRVGQQKGVLMRKGIYGVVRHPRYLSAGVGIIASALLINYEGLYLMLLLLAPVGYLMIVLEERELIERFGEEYRRYQREVPRLIPRWRKPIQNDT